jgi:hypothetical protein
MLAWKINYRRGANVKTDCPPWGLAQAMTPGINQKKSEDYCRNLHK